MKMTFGASCCHFAGTAPRGQKRGGENHTLASKQPAFTLKITDAGDSFVRSEKPKLQFGASCCQ
jgi:hypothetical protein